ncbi:MAG: hypothetical protein VB144_01245 [Clostridia bacterium]|nr:hypothetical protein [Clostridia bacterium]
MLNVRAEDDVTKGFLGGLQVVVIPAYRGRGLSSSIILEIISLARRDGHSTLILPVRPSLKSRCPLTSSR